MGPPLPEKLRVTTAVLGALSIITTVLRCYVRTRIVKNWGHDDTFIVIAFIFHMWYEGTLLTGIHYGTGRRTADISPTDAVHAMRCWWLCFLAYATTITLAKISAGFFFLRITGTLAFHRITTIFVTVLAALVGFAFLFLSVFQCSPVQYFWTRLEGKPGTCIDIEIMIAMTYFYGSVSAFTDLAFGVLVAVMLWNLKVDKKTKILIAPFLAMACIASYAAIVRMPYVKNFRNPDFLYATVEISLWSTVEVGVSIFAANLATLRPLAQKIVDVSRNTSSIFRRTTTHPVEKVEDAVIDNQLKKSGIALVEVKDCESPISDRLDTSEKTERDDGSTASLTRSTRCPV